MNTRLDLLEENGSVEPGHQSPRPPTPFDFTFHAFVPRAILIDDGIYAGRSIRFAGISYAERNGEFLTPCFNLSGMFVETPKAPPEGPPEVKTPPAGHEEPPPPPPQFADVKVSKIWLDKKGQKTRAPKNYNLGIRVVNDSTRSVERKLELNNVSEVTVQRLVLNAGFNFEEELDTIPKGFRWKSNGFAQAKDGATATITNEKVGGGFCGPWKGVRCWAPLATIIIACALKCDDIGGHSGHRTTTQTTPPVVTVPGKDGGGNLPPRPQWTVFKF
jgi:hypothetical protein